VTPADEPTADVVADTALPVSIFSTTILDAKAKCSYATTVTTVKLAESAITATPETAAIILPGSPVIVESTKPREPDFRPLFQVWHEWSLCSALP
jgi:hypothetical protein